MKKVADEFIKGAKVEEFVGGAVVKEQIVALEKTKEPIRKGVASTAAKRERVRMVESKVQRTVHFVFQTGQKSIITPFARKYLRVLDGTIKQFEDEEREKFA